MILSDRQIMEAIRQGDIYIDPFYQDRLGSNSYDVTLSNILLYFDPKEDLNTGGIGALDAKLPPKMKRVDLNDYPNGYILRPGILYLGAINEYTETRNLVPWIDGRSSTGRLGISIHCTAGKGDNGFKGYFTLEIWCVVPVRIYNNIRIGQITYFTTGPADIPYDQKPSQNYSNQGPEPQPSKMWTSFSKK